MSDEGSEIKAFARRLFQENKQFFDLLKARSSASGFELAIHRLMGGSPQEKKVVSIGATPIICSEATKNALSFVPLRWRDEFDKASGPWRGCENWRAGYPFIVWVEIRGRDDGTRGHLKLNAEVGPIANRKIRMGIIDAIAMEASARNLERIHFPTGSSDEKNLYSRFLRLNSIPVNDVQDVGEIESKIVQLVNGFTPEFEMIARLIPLFCSSSNPLWASR
ncbi:hypothetical protein [Rhizobium sp. CECT 9324]|uniref:hypothetical protein n=1 Tax=Rhizobium sp. CECT 9324 TaxID=2845820 RepID=UPI001E5693AE|nr:hypothetical protein [Rhizobium sp. CECT 9324]CAH0343154.1 hypothetical protein RHI9324_04887 [Rhizobium sp. CECT 9324]